MGWSSTHGRLRFRPGHAIAALCAVLLIGEVASAQDLRPGQERPKLPEFQTDAERARERETLPKVPSFQPEATEPGTALPRIELPQTLPGGARARIREVRISGNTAIARPEGSRNWLYSTVNCATLLMRGSRQLQGTIRWRLVRIGPLRRACAIDGAPAGFAKLWRGSRITRAPLPAVDSDKVNGR